MWPRYLEILLGFWLIASPWVFAHPEPHLRRLNEIASGAAVGSKELKAEFQAADMVPNLACD